MKTRKNLEPRASALVESMRDVGYSLATAIADIIDNSIAAEARRVEILVDTNSDCPMIGIIDDGIGMIAADLYEAMRPGTRSPLEERSEADLGRFGLGLKTASFSQCRRLTVVSRRNRETACAVWDLDYVVATNQWSIETPNSCRELPWIDRLGENGTLVLWENLDRLLDTSADKSRQNIKRQIDESISHIEFVFHRFLSASASSYRHLKIFLNGRQLHAFDPFNSSHSATQFHPEEVIKFKGSEIRIQPVTLPHHHKTSAADWERYAGNEGYIKNQGFYVYRNDRLIIHGTWFGLARQAELTKLSRVQINVPNCLDAEWKVDIRKASAQPPPAIRERLRKLMERIAVPSKRTFRERGSRLTSSNQLPVWVRIQKGDYISYEINREHPVISQFIRNVDAAISAQFSILMDMVAKALPLDALFADISEHPSDLRMFDLPTENLLELAKTTLDELHKNGFSERESILIMQSAEPFKSNWIVIEKELLLHTSKR